MLGGMLGGGGGGLLGNMFGGGGGGGALGGGLNKIMGSLGRKKTPPANVMDNKSMKKGGAVKKTMKSGGSMKKCKYGCK